MTVLWINPSFLDYRVPVYDALNTLLDGNLYIVFSADAHRTPGRVVQKIKEKLQDHAIGLTGEKTLRIGNTSSDYANKFINIPYQPGLYSTVMEINADVIIVEGFFQWAPYGYLKKLIHRKPLVLSYERTFHTERQSGFLRKLYRKFVANFLIDAAVVNGRLSKEYTASLGVDEENILTGGMSADSAFFREQAIGLDKEECKRKWDLDAYKLVYLYVGQIVDRKGVLELLQHWNMFDESCALVCAGDGSLMPEAKRIIKENNMRNVHMLGTVDYADLPQLYMASDVFVMPTLEDNWSLVVPEAMACGLPIACSKYNGCWPELVNDGVNGKVFDPLDDTDTLACLHYFLDHRDRLDEMGRRSEKIESDFSPVNAAKVIFKACQMVLSENQTKSL